MKPNLMNVTLLVNLATRATEASGHINVNSIYMVTEVDMKSHDLPPATRIEFDNKEWIIIKGSCEENVAKIKCL